MLRRAVAVEGDGLGPSEPGAPPAVTAATDATREGSEDELEGTDSSVTLGPNLDSIIALDA